MTSIIVLNAIWALSLTISVAMAVMIDKSSMNTLSQMDKELCNV